MMTKGTWRFVEILFYTDEFCKVT